MEEIDSERYRWILYERGEQLFLDALCSHSAAYYSWMIELNHEENRKFREQGREYLNELSYEIHCSAPGVNGNRSPFSERRVERNRLNI